MFRPLSSRLFLYCARVVSYSSDLLVTKTIQQRQQARDFRCAPAGRRVPTFASGITVDGDRVAIGIGTGERVIAYGDIVEGFVVQLLVMTDQVEGRIQELSTDVVLEISLKASMSARSNES